MAETYVKIFWEMRAKVFVHFVLITLDPTAHTGDVLLKDHFEKREREREKGGPN